MENPLQKYLDLASQSEDLKSGERLLSASLDNLKEIKSLLMEKEKEFCNNDQVHRTSSQSNECDILNSRCLNLIDHLVHLKCVVECLSGDLLAMGSDLLSDDEFINLSLVFREAEISILQDIKTNQKRIEKIHNMREDQARSSLADLDKRWHIEHQERRQLISRIIANQNQIVTEKMAENLQKQQALLSQRYESVNNLIKSLSIDRLYHM